MPEADENRVVNCVKLKQSLPGLDKQPFPSDFGKLIYDHVSKEAWDQWLKESVKYINTYRVDLASREGAEFMVKQMKIYFGFEDGEMAQTAWQPDAEKNAANSKEP